MSVFAVVSGSCCKVLQREQAALVVPHCGVTFFQLRMKRSQGDMRRFQLRMRRSPLKNVTSLVENRTLPAENETFGIKKRARLDLSSFSDMYENNAASFNARQIVLTEYPMRINRASGCMDDFCVYGRALREGEIVTLCNMGG